MNASNLSSEKKPVRGHSVAVLVIAPQGIPLVRDPKKPPPVFWKAPGGRSLPGETAEETALREIKEELGIELVAGNLSVVYREDRASHVLTLFAARIPSLPPLKKTGNEGEEIKIFSPEEIIALSDFFPNHKKIYGKIIEAL